MRVKQFEWKEEFELCAPRTFRRITNEHEKERKRKQVTHYFIPCTNLLKQRRRTLFVRKERE